jgi:hypothetical protein
MFADEEHRCSIQEVKTYLHVPLSMNEYLQQQSSQQYQRPASLWVVPGDRKSLLDASLYARPFVSLPQGVSVACAVHS